MSKTSGIMCYATPEDRLRLAAIARVEATSGSAWLLQKIREGYAALYGDMPPELAK